MPKPQTLWNDEIRSYEQLDTALRALAGTDKLTSTQYNVAKDLLRSRIPAHVIIEQRTPKSVTIFRLNGECLRMNNRAKVITKLQ